MDRPTPASHEQAEAEADHQRADRHGQAIETARHEHKNIGQILHQPAAPQTSGGTPLQNPPDSDLLIPKLWSEMHPAFQQPQTQAINQKPQTEGDAIADQRRRQQGADPGRLKRAQHQERCAQWCAPPGQQQRHHRRQNVNPGEGVRQGKRSTGHHQTPPGWVTVVEKPAQQQHHGGEHAEEQHLPPLRRCLVVGGDVGAQGLQGVVPDDGAGRQHKADDHPAIQLPTGEDRHARQFTTVSCRIPASRTHAARASI